MFIVFLYVFYFYVFTGRRGFDRFSYCYGVVCGSVLSYGNANPMLSQVFQQLVLIVYESIKQEDSF